MKKSRYTEEKIIGVLKQREAALQKAVPELPIRARSGEWAEKVRQAAAKAIAAHGGSRDQETLDRVALAAAAPVVRQYGHEQRISEAIDGLRYWRSFQATDKERTEAVRACVDAFAALPVGASQAEIDEAKEEALRPLEQAVEARLQEARREEAARRIADKAVRLLHVYLSLGWEWDSYDEQQQITRELAEDLRPLIEREYLAVRLDEDCLQEWADKQLDFDDKD